MPEEQRETQGLPAKKSNTTMIIIIIVVALLVLGVGGLLLSRWLVW